MDQETFAGVVLTRPGMTALLAEDGERVTLMHSEEVNAAHWNSMLDELHRAGLPSGLDVLDEWTEESEDGSLWVTVLG